MKKTLLLLILLSFIVTSCNVVQMVTQGETDVPDGFFDDHKGGHESVIFLVCDNGNGGERLCAFSTRDHSIKELHPNAQASSTGTSAFAIYKGNVIFTGWMATNNVYRYDFNTGNSTFVDSGDAKGFTQFDQHLYYISTNGNTIKAMSDSNFTPFALTGGGLTYASSFWLKSFYGNNTGKLIMCKNNGLDSLHTVSVNNSGNPSTVSITSINPPPGGTNEVVCGNGKPQAYDRHFLHAQAAGKVVHYDVIFDIYKEWSVPGSVANDVDINDDGVFFYSGEIDAATYRLFKYDIENDVSGTTLVADQFVPNNFLSVFGSPSGETLFVNKDGSSVDQLYREIGGVAQAVTSFTNDGANILHYTIGSKGFYFVRANGIYLMDFEGNMSTIPSPTIFNKGFESFSEGEIYNTH